MKFAESIIPDPIVIRLRREEESLENIRQFYVLCSGMEQKFEALSNMYGVISIGQCIVFCHVSVSIFNLELTLKIVRIQNHNSTHNKILKLNFTCTKRFQAILSIPPGTGCRMEILDYIRLPF